MMLGFILRDDDTEKLLEVSEYSEKEPYEIVVEAINVMHRAMIADDEE